MYISQSGLAYGPRVMRPIQVAGKEQGKVIDSELVIWNMGWIWGYTGGIDSTSSYPTWLWAGEHVQKYPQLLPM